MEAGGGEPHSRRPGPGGPLLPPSREVVHLWWVPVPVTGLHPTVATSSGSGPGGPSSLLAELSATERARAARFRAPADRARFLFARKALRELSARYTGLPPSSLDLVPRGNGKPELQVQGEPLSLRVNLSHSGSWAILAFASRREVGVDLEKVRPLPDPFELARFILHPEEASQLVSSPSPLPLEGFYRGWTRKEALLKAMGRGIDGEAASLRAGIDAPLLTLALPFSWSVMSIAAPPGYHAAVALEGETLVPEAMGVFDPGDADGISAGWVPTPPDGAP